MDGMDDDAKRTSQANNADACHQHHPRDSSGRDPGAQVPYLEVVLYSCTDHCNRFISDDTEYRFWAEEVL